MPDPSDSLPSESLADGLETQKPSRLLWWLHPKVALPLLLLGLLLVAPFLYRGYRIASIPDIGDPFDVEAFGTVDIAPADNAMTQYAIAAKLIVNRTHPNEDLDKALDGGWEQTSEPVRKWLDDNQTALAEWRKGTERSQAVLFQPKDLRIDTRIESIPEIRELTQLARLQVERCLHEEDHVAAWEWLRAAIRANRHVPQHGFLIQRMFGASTHSDAAQGIARWAAHPDVTAELLQKALSDYHAAEQLTTANSVTLKYEYCIFRNLLLHENELQEFLVKEGIGSLWFRPRGRFVSGEPAYSLRIVQHIYRNLLSEIDKPPRDRAPLAAGIRHLYDLPSGAIPSLPARELEWRARSGDFVNYFAPDYTTTNIAMQREAARRAAVSLLLACQLHHRLHGDWPAKVEDLVPDILAEPPADPLGKAGELMRIRREGHPLLKRDSDRLVIYSIGPNGVDDGGMISSKGGHDGADEGDYLAPPATRANSSSSESKPSEQP